MPSRISKPRDIGSWVFAAGIIALALVIFARPTPKAPVPALFASGAETLDDAMRRSEASGRPIFAFATADWCGPCQVYKKNALADPRVAEWVGANAEPVYIDIDASPDDARRLGVRPIPATFLIKDGRVIGKAEGVMSADALLSWLNTNAAG